MVVVPLDPSRDGVLLLGLTDDNIRLLKEGYIGHFGLTEKGMKFRGNVVLTYADEEGNYNVPKARKSPPNYLVKLDEETVEGMAEAIIADFENDDEDDTILSIAVIRGKSNIALENEIRSLFGDEVTIFHSDSEHPDGRHLIHAIPSLN